MFPVDFFFLGGRLAVDLLNTVVVPDGRVRDLLSRRVDVASWGEAAGELARRDLRNAAREPAVLRAFREPLRRALAAWAPARPPPAPLVLHAAVWRPRQSARVPAAGWSAVRELTSSRGRSLNHASLGHLGQLWPVATS